MKLILASVLALAVLFIGAADAVRVGGKYATRWGSYVQRNGLTFQSSAAELKTYATYSANLDYINSWNSNPENTFKLKETQFTHLSTQEMRKQVLMPNRPVTQASSTGKQASAPRVGLNLKPLVNWTDYFGPAKNQGYCGSCYTFAAVRTCYLFLISGRDSHYLKLKSKLYSRLVS